MEENIEYLDLNKNRKYFKKVKNNKENTPKR